MKLIALMLALATVSFGATISYTVLTNGTVLGVNNQPPGSQNDPTGADYYVFAANAGDNITLYGDRLAGHFDMSFWVFSGTFADTNDFGGSFTGAEPQFIAFGDDQDPPNLPGPFGDPRAVFLATTSGLYTVAVVNFLSSAGPPNPYSLTLSGSSVPEPSTYVLLGAGLLAMAALRRRRN